MDEGHWYERGKTIGRLPPARPPPLATAAILSLMAFVMVRYGGRVTDNRKAPNGRVGAFNARIDENAGGIRVKAFANGPHERAGFATDNARHRAAKLKAYRRMAAARSIIRTPSRRCRSMNFGPEDDIAQF